MEMVRKHTSEEWIILYIQRWLTAPFQTLYVSFSIRTKRKLLQTLEERLKKFGLELASDKSKIIRFGRFAKQHSKDGKTDTFDFLGFTHINGKTRTGKYRVEHRTSKKKLKAKKQT